MNKKEVQEMLTTYHKELMAHEDNYFHVHKNVIKGGGLVLLAAPIAFIIYIIMRIMEILASYPFSNWIISGARILGMLTSILLILLVSYMLGFGFTMMGERD